jgi:hypothetical protein
MEPFFAILEIGARDPDAETMQSRMKGIPAGLEESIEVITVGER